MATIGSLNVTIGADTTALERGVNRARGELSTLSSRATVAAKAIAGVTAAAAAAGAAIVGFTQHVAQGAKELRNMASLANTTTQEFQRMAHGARTVGIEQDKLADILKDVNDRVGDFMTTGGGEMADFFDQIAPKVGVTADQFARLSGPEALQLYFDSLEKAGASQQEMTFFMESMADEATALIPLLRDGGAGFRRMAEEADQLGFVLSDLDLARLKDFGEQFQRITSILSGLANVVAAELSPFLAEAADRMIDTANSAESFRISARTAIRETVAAIGPLLDAFHAIRIAIQGANAAALTMGVTFLRIGTIVPRTIGQIVEEVLGGINAMIRQVNKLPVIEFGELDAEIDVLTSANDSLDALSDAASGARQDLMNLVRGDMPSASVDRFLDDVDARINAFRENLQQEGGLLGGAVGGGGGVGTQGRGAGGGGGDTEDPEDAGRFLGGIGIFGEQESQAFIERLRAMLETRQEILREFDVLNEERQQEAFEREMERLREGLELKAITEQEYRDAQLEAERNYWSQRFGITQDAESGITALVDSFNDKRISSYATAFDSILNSLSEHSKAAFNIQKGLAIAAATIDAYEAITGAYKVGARIGGPPLGAAFAAAAGAAQFATIAKIASTQFNGGASSGGGSGGSASAGGGGGGSTAGGQPAQEQQRENTIVTINIAEEGMFSGRQVRGLIESINDELDNGMRLRVR